MYSRRFDSLKVEPIDHHLETLSATINYSPYPFWSVVRQSVSPKCGGIDRNSEYATVVSERQDLNTCLPFGPTSQDPRGTNPTMVA